MQPASLKNKNGKETWSQEIWAMYQLRGAGNPKSEAQIQKLPHPALRATFSQREKGIKIISAWRYPGVSSKRDPIPEEILREVEESLGQT